MLDMCLQILELALLPLSFALHVQKLLCFSYPIFFCSSVGRISFWRE
jgi:hypothetical protein